MPRLSADRDSFVRRIERRREAARWVAHARRKVGLARGSLQADVYDGTFRSDEEAVSYFYALKNDHLPDFETPTWVNEKVRWQFLNHPNPLMSLAADKIAVRDYLRLKGAEIAPPTLFAAGSGPADLARTDLPARFALKLASSSGQNHFEDGARPTPRRDLAAKLRHWSQFEYWRHAGEMHYRGLDRRWLVEELLVPRGRIVEYKFYCILGEPVFILVIAERDGTRYSSALFDLAWRPVDFHWRGYPATAAETPRPAALDLLVSEARRLSEDFLHVRVDFLQCGDRLVFSELTFSGGAARNPFVPLIKNEEFAERLDLGAADERLQRGRAIAATLGWNAPRPAEVVAEPFRAVLGGIARPAGV